MHFLVSNSCQANNSEALKQTNHSRRRMVSIKITMDHLTRATQSLWNEIQLMSVQFIMLKDLEKQQV